MNKGDGKKPKFRILCKRCNSYQYTSFKHPGIMVALRIECSKCGNVANSFHEEEEEA